MSGPDVRLVRTPGEAFPRSIIGEARFGYPTFISASLPERLWTGVPPAQRVMTVRHGDREAILTPIASPAEKYLLCAAEGIPVEATRAALRRLEALWLLVEDEHRLLDAERIEPLAHQASLVKHVLETPSMKRVLIADEVGLGKTIEAGLIIKRLREKQELSVLYLTESRLVENVAEEFRILDMRPRVWSSSLEEARISDDDSDPLVIASMHLAVANDNRFDRVAKSGPWDVIVVDEAHHLSDYSPDGGDPRRRMKLLRVLLANRLRSEGRLILLTATPHQGHLDRYKNLLRLLSPTEDEHEARGRVIYRLKEDIRDWDGNPLFPIRRVHPPTPVAVDGSYRNWLESVRSLFTSSEESRAAGWRRAQALQWCASSPMAGVAYLARYALRLGIDPEGELLLREAITALRPYRGGPVDETWPSLLGRLSATIKSTSDWDAEDGIDADAAHQKELLHCLGEGAELLRFDAFRAKLEVLKRELDHAPKLVVFAQPVETVWAIRDRLEAELGEGSVSIVVGGQRDDERRHQIERFWEVDGGCRVLVSSRSGGEGINLQVCNRLVHFDVPWNPMEMEQRVGRVHRYGSVDEIHVHTLILEGSREERVLERARAKLAAISSAVGWDAERREQFFSRTMSLLPVDDLTALMVGENLGPLSEAEEEHLQGLVQTGFERWRSVDREFRELSGPLSEVDRGPLVDSDLEHALQSLLGAEPQLGWTASRLIESEGETNSVPQPMAVYRLPSGELGTVGRLRGVSLTDADGNRRRATRFGLNHEEVADRLRSVCQIGAGASDPRRSDGVGSIEIDAESWTRFFGDACGGAAECVVCVTVYTLIDVQASAEVGCGVVVTVQAPTGDPRFLDRRMGAELIRAAIQGRPSRRERRFATPSLGSIDREVGSRLQRQLPEEGGIVPAQFPVICLHAYSA